MALTWFLLVQVLGATAFVSVEQVNCILDAQGRPVVARLPFGTSVEVVVPSIEGSSTAQVLVDGVLACRIDTHALSPTLPSTSDYLDHARRALQRVGETSETNTADLWQAGDMTAAGLMQYPTSSALGAMACGISAACSTTPGADAVLASLQATEPAHAEQQPPDASPALTQGSPSTFRKVVVGYAHSCALTESGGVWCWGGNDEGTLGAGTLVPRSPSPLPVRGLGSGVADLFAGAEKTCAILEAGPVRCWGFGAGGQLGQRTQQYALARAYTEPGVELLESAVPVDVRALPCGVTSIALGERVGCAVVHGALWCWGDAFLGRFRELVGASNRCASTVSPVKDLATGIRKVVVVNDAPCVLLDDGTVRCLTEQRVPVDSEAEYVMKGTIKTVLGPEAGVVDLVAGFTHQCVLLKDHSVACWGQNDEGQAGQRPSKTPVRQPRRVAGLPPNIESIAAGGRTTCALTTEHTVACWGRGLPMQGGKPGPANSRPTVNEAFAGVRQIALGGTFHACTLDEAGGVQCFGSDTYHTR